MVLLKRAAAIRLGWFQDSSITPSGLFPQPKPADGGPRTQESFVNFNIRVRLFERLMSPRMFSSRQGEGVLRDFVQFKFVQGSDSVGAGYWVISRRACEVVFPTMLVPKLKLPEGPAGSWSPGTKTPLLSAVSCIGKPALLVPDPSPFFKEFGQAATALKSPVRSSMPGT